MHHILSVLCSVHDLTIRLIPDHFKIGNALDKTIKLTVPVKLDIKSSVPSAYLKTECCKRDSAVSASSHDLTDILDRGVLLVLLIPKTDRDLAALLIENDRRDILQEF